MKYDLRMMDCDPRVTVSMITGSWGIKIYLARSRVGRCYFSFLLRQLWSIWLLHKKEWVKVVNMLKSLWSMLFYLCVVWQCLLLDVDNVWESGRGGASLCSAVCGGMVRGWIVKHRQQCNDVGHTTLDIPSDIVSRATSWTWSLSRRRLNRKSLKHTKRLLTTSTGTKAEKFQSK